MLSCSSTCQSKARLTGKTAVITGANSGIGKETARDLYWRGARVILACRNLERANEAVEEIMKVPPSKPEREQFQGEPGELAVYELNLASFASVRECAKKLSTTESEIHLLINNAGVMMCPEEKTENGYEMQLQSGRMNFDDLNLYNEYSPLEAYNQSKLANILFTKELARKLKDAEIKGISTYSLHPGVIASELSRHLNQTMFPGARTMLLMTKCFMKTPELGAQTTIYCATDEAAENETGLYYKERKATSPSNRAKSVEDAARLWAESLKMVGLPTNENLTKLLTAIEAEILSSS